MREIPKILCMILMVAVFTSGCGKIQQTNKKKSDQRKNTDINSMKITPEQDYNDGEHILGIVGLKEYDEIKSKQYRDTPAEGKKFLVLFLKCRNAAEEQLYINEAELESKLDGKKLDHTILMNDPEGYPTFFRNFPTGDKDFGFIVWEVPENWEKLDIIYHGLEYTNQNKIEMRFTKKDLMDPQAYNDILPH